jgi:D-glycero-D-manno-heptose 1,7-bisphosphate phosphatase
VKRGVVLDRDGTLIEEVGYLSRLDQVSFFPYSVDAVRLLNRAGLTVIVATNQAGVAKGLFDEAFVAETHRRIAEVLETGGARVDAFYYCPHHPEGTIDRYRMACECRKPKAGLLQRAAADHQIDLRRSFMVGDRAHDLEAALAVGASGALVRSGYGVQHEQAAQGLGAPVFDNLMQAVSWILRQS